MVGAKLPKSQSGIRVITSLNAILSGYTLEAGVQTCFTVGVPAVPVSSVGLKFTNPVIKPLLLGCDIQLSLYPPHCLSVFQCEAAAVTDKQ